MSPFLSALLAAGITILLIASEAEPRPAAFSGAPGFRCVANVATPDGHLFLPCRDTALGLAWREI